MGIETADVVIAGAGVIGLSIAYELGRRHAGRILVFDKANGLGEGSTGASSAVCRFRYSRVEMVRLARDGITAYQKWSDYLETPNPRAAYARIGNVWLGRTPGAYDGEVARLRAAGVRSEFLDDRALAEAYPAINPCTRDVDADHFDQHVCGRGGRHLHEPDAGYIEPMDVLQDLLDACRRHGVNVRFGVGVQGLQKTGGAISAVVTDVGVISTPVLVNAAGPWARELNKRIGLDNPWPLKPTRIQIVEIDRPIDAVGPIPVCADPVSGIYFRPQSGGRRLLVGSIMPEDEREHLDDADRLDRYADDVFVRDKLFALQHRVPSFSYAGKIRGYGGLYTINTLDMHPIVGATPIEGFFVANGCSGHGFKIAPAIGSLAAQAITGKRIDTDTRESLDFLRFDRAPIGGVSMSVVA